MISKGISTLTSTNTYRGSIIILSSAKNSRNYSQCDSLLINNESNANTFPHICIKNSTSKIEHEASTSKVDDKKLFYFAQRGIRGEKALSLLVTGFCQNIFIKLPIRLVTDANSLLKLKLRSTVG
jgi:Fe-S cluster assembly protein SufB